MLKLLKINDLHYLKKIKIFGRLVPLKWLEML